jgi:hypothetical protein
MNYWLHRISYHAEVSYPLLSNNLLTIGFSDFAYPEFIDTVLEHGWDAIDEAFDEQWGDRPRTRHNLWRFVHGMKQGDWVIVPSWGTFSIYELVESKPQIIGHTQLPNIADWHGHQLTLSHESLKPKLLVNKEGKNIDLGFTWEVRPVAIDMSRSEFADAALTARLKVRTTNAWITDIKDSIDKALDAFKLNRPINLRSQIIDATVPIIKQRFASELNPDRLERLVCWYFQKVGASEAIIPSRNENGKEGDADVVAVFEGIKTIIYAQVKFHQGETSSWALEQIREYRDNKELMDDGYTKISWVVSTADRFSDDCYSLAKEYRVHLIDGAKLAEMLLEVGLTNLDKAL